MALTLITGPANAGKARAVLDEVRREADRGSEPLLVLPTRADVEHYRRELAEGGTIFGVRLERFAGLIGEIALRVGLPGRPLGVVAREHLAGAVTRELKLGPLAEAARTPGFGRALAALGAELGAQRVTPARLRGALRVWAADEGEPAGIGLADDLGTLYEAYRRALGRVGRADPELYAGRALDALRASPGRWRATPVLFYGFDDLTAVELDAIETLSGVVDAPVTVSLAYEAGRLAFSGRATTFQTLAPGATTHRALAARAEYYAPGARAPLHHLERSLFEADAPPIDARPAVRLLEGGGERAELELVAGEIRALLDDGMAPSEIAVVVRTPAAVAPLLGEIFEAHAIPHTLAPRLRFLDTALGRGAVALLRASVLKGSGDDLLAWLRTPGLLERPELADRLEAAMRVSGADSATAARQLWERTGWSLDALDRLADAAGRGPVALLERMSEEIERLFSAPFRRRAPVLSETERADARALAAARRALQELSELSGAAPDLGPDAAGLLAALEGLTLPVDSDGAGGGDSVLVVDPLALRARRVRALFLCRVQESEFPAPAAPEPFLADEERRRLAQVSGLRLPRRDDTLGSERYLLYATVSRPQELLVISWHVADDDGSPATPSLFVQDICDLFTPALREGRRRRALGAVDWPGPGRPTPAAEARVQARAGGGRAPAGIAPLSDPRVVEDLRETAVWSASGLETWAGCPVRWFVERRLRASALEPDPEPMTRGGIAHAVLEQTLLDLLERTGSARLDPGSLPVARRLMHETLERALEERPLSVAPERRPGARRRLEADLERYLEHAARQASPLEPRHLELAFGFDDGEHPALDLGEGVRVRGRIDRVDVGRGGEAVVYDYKGRNVPEPNRWVSGANFQIALYMRAAEQLLGLHAVGGFYQPLGNRDPRPRGLLDADSGVELECVNGDRREHAEFEGLLEQVVAAAREAAVQARAGALQSRPDTCGWGGGCAYPTICRCER